MAEGIVTRRSPLGAAHWARSTPTAWAIREIRAHESLFNAFDAVLKKGAALRGALMPRSRRGPAQVNQPSSGDRAADREPSNEVMTLR